MGENEWLRSCEDLWHFTQYLYSLPIGFQAIQHQKPSALAGSYQVKDNCCCYGNRRAMGDDQALANANIPALKMMAIGIVTSQARLIFRTTPS